MLELAQRGGVDPNDTIFGLDNLRHTLEESLATFTPELGLGIPASNQCNASGVEDDAYVINPHHNSCFSISRTKIVYFVGNPKSAVVLYHIFCVADVGSAVRQDVNRNKVELWLVRHTVRRDVERSGSQQCPTLVGGHRLLGSAPTHHRTGLDLDKVQYTATRCDDVDLVAAIAPVQFVYDVIILYILFFYSGKNSKFVKISSTVNSKNSKLI